MTAATSAKPSSLCWIRPGEDIELGTLGRLRVLDVVAVMETESPVVAFLKVQPL